MLAEHAKSTPFWGRIVSGNQLPSLPRRALRPWPGIRQDNASTRQQARTGCLGWTARRPPSHAGRHSDPRPAIPNRCPSPTRTNAPDGSGSGNRTESARLTRRALFGHALAGRLPLACPPTLPGPTVNGTGPSCRQETNLDAELLQQCRIVRALGDEEVTGHDDRWTQALLRVGALQPATLDGLQAKAQVALSLMPFGASDTVPAWASPDERLLWSLLNDLLALIGGQNTDPCTRARDSEQKPSILAAHRLDY